MTRTLIGNIGRLLAFGATAAVLLYLFIKAQPVSPEAHNRLSGDLRELQARDIELSEAVLQQHYQLLHNYDGVVYTLQRMRALHKALQQSIDGGGLPDQPAIRQELGEMGQAIQQKADSLEEFKSDNAVSKTALIYLPVTIDAIEAQLPGNSLFHARFNHLLQDALLLSTGQNGRASTALAQDIDAVEQIIPALPPATAPQAQIAVTHARNILSNENNMADAIALLAASGQPRIGARLEELYLNHYQQQQSAAALYRACLLLVAVLAFGYAIYAYYEMLEKAAQLRIAAAAFASQESLMITDVNGIILRVNHAFTQTTGYLPEEAIGQTPQALLKSGRHNEDFYKQMWDAIAQTGSWQGEVWDRRKNGEIYPMWLTISAVRQSNGVVTHYVGAHMDITERKRAEEKIRQLAFHDPLTSLPNRQLLLDRLQQAQVASARSGLHGALLFIDLDNFKTLNDTLGHLSGDLLLQQVAERLSTCVREGDTVARLGGDEFVLLLEDLSGMSVEAAAQTEAVGAKILDKLSRPYQLGSNEHQCTTSIGATLLSNRPQPMEELLKQADIAMYQSKKAGRNTLRFFDPQMQEAINQRAALEKDLGQALGKRQFHLYYQVQVDNARRPFGAEALLRWDHPERGLVQPAQFIALAEETGLILPIGLWVLEAACAQLRSWEQSALARDLVLSVNVSARQFYQAGFVAQVQAVVLHHQINPSRLKLELTESMLLENIEDTIATIHALEAIGIRFSLDDFGTGYSSLQYLKRLSLSQLKIDQSFVRDIATDSSDRAIVQTIIAMAQTLGLEVIAEGVETEEQRQFLLDSGCTHYQGHLFSQPVAIHQFEAMLNLAA